MESYGDFQGEQEGQAGQIQLKYHKDLRETTEPFADAASPGDHPL